MRWSHSLLKVYEIVSVFIYVGEFLWMDWATAYTRLFSGSVNSLLSSGILAWWCPQFIASKCLAIYFHIVFLIFYKLFNIYIKSTFLFCSLCFLRNSNRIIFSSLDIFGNIHILIRLSCNFFNSLLQISFHWWF